MATKPDFLDDETNDKLADAKLGGRPKTILDETEMNQTLGMLDKYADDINTEVEGLLAAPGGGGGYWSFVNEYTTTASGSLVIGSLDIDTDKEYMLEWALTNTINQGLSVGALPNGDTSYQSPNTPPTKKYYNNPQFLTGPSGLFSVDGAPGTVSSMGTGKMVFKKFYGPVDGEAVVFELLEGMTAAEADGGVNFTAQSITQSAQPVIWYPGAGGGSWSNVTSLTLLAAQTNSPFPAASDRNFTAGDKVRLYKRA